MQLQLVEEILGLQKALKNSWVESYLKETFSIDYLSISIRRI